MKPPVVPTITDDIKEFAKRLGAQGLTYVRCHPFKWSQTLRCAQNVEDACNEYGGKPITGFSLWDNSGLWLGAEAHVVWDSPTEGVVDVTPDPYGWPCKRILFAPVDMTADHLLQMSDPRYWERGLHLLDESDEVKAIIQHHMEATTRIWEYSKANGGKQPPEWMQDEFNRHIEQMETDIKRYKAQRKVAT